MKKILIILGVICLVATSCEDAPLDKTATPDNQLNIIQVITSDNQGANIDEDTGIEIPKAVFTNTDVTFKSNTDPQLVQSRLWLIPQPEARPAAGGTTNINITEFTTAEPTVQFLRDNETTQNSENQGFIINLIETLTDGSIKRANVQVGVRRPLTPDIVPIGDRVTRGEQINLTLLSPAQLGLSQSDFNTTMTWTIIDKGVFNLPNGETTDTRIIEFGQDEFNSPSQIPITFTELGEGSFSLKITRNEPIFSEVEKVFTVEVVDVLVPSGGDKDPIKLSADGSRINILYTESITNTGSIGAGDYVLNYDNSLFPSFSTTINNIQFNGDNDVITLVLSESIPSFMMDSVTLDYTGTGIMSESGKVLDIFEDLKVFPTGTNEFNADFSGFEVETGVWDNGWEPQHLAEILFSTERALLGSQSMLFNITSSPTVLGAFRHETDPIIFSPSQTGTFEVSYWVYVESTDATASLNLFWLDGSSVQWLVSVGAIINQLDTNRWVKVSGQRDFSQGAKTDPLIRVTEGNARFFVDHIDIRPVDDGR